MASGGNLSRTLEGGHQSFYDFPCSLCDEQEKHVEATKYCEECVVYMCDSCMRTIHNRIPLNTRHKLLDQGKFTAVRQSALKSFPTNRCLKHPGELMNIFCGDHDVVCCSVCKALAHSTCNKIQHLPDAAKGIKTSTEYQNVRKETQIFLSDLDKLLHDRKGEKSRIDKEKQEVKRTIADFRKKANKYLDDLEQKSLNELNFKETSIINGLEQDRKFLDKTKQEAEDIIKQLNSFNGDNECELFSHVKSCKSFIKTSTEKVDDISSTAPESIVFTKDANIEKYLSSLFTLGWYDDKHLVTVKSSLTASDTRTSSAQLPHRKVAEPRRKDQSTISDNIGGKSEDNSSWYDGATNKGMSPVKKVDVGAIVRLKHGYARGLYGDGSVTSVYPDGRVIVNWTHGGTLGPYTVGTGGEVSLI